MGVSVGSRNGLLYTLNAQVPEDRWQDAKVKLQQSANSLRVFDTGAGILDYPQRLQ